MDPNVAQQKAADMSKEPPGARPEKKPHFTTAHDNTRDPFREYIKKMYDEVAREPLPEELQRLLEELDKPQQGHAASSRRGEGQGDA